MGLLTTRTRTALVAALAAERLLELRVSARNRSRGGAATQASPRTYPVMVGVHVALFAASARPRRRTVPLAVEAVALAGLASATALRIWVIRSLGTRWTVTAHVSPTASVVTGGPYRRLRHPNYTAVAVEVACLPIAVGAYLEAGFLSAANLAVLWPRIVAEERLLDQLPGYREAFAGVPRFVPRLRRRPVTAQTPASASQSRGVSRPNPQ